MSSLLPLQNMGPSILEPPEGYDRLGNLMGDASETAIFRRFGALSAENLLYLQAELQELEETFRRFQKDDRNSGHPDRIRYGRYWHVLSKSVEPGAKEGNKGNQWQTMLAIRSKLKEYYEALLQHRQILELGQPNKTHLHTLHTWMTGINQGNVHLIGSDRKIWKTEEPDDLVALAPPSQDDALNSGIWVTLQGFYHNIIGRFIHEEEPKDYLRGSLRYKDKTSFAVFKTFITLVACLLPSAGIVVLYMIQNMTIRLGIIALLTGVFSICMNWVTSASMKDIFSATATFVAVLVVFVNTDSNASPECVCVAAS